MRMCDLSVLQILVRSPDVHLQAHNSLIVTVFLLIFPFALPFLQGRYLPVPFRIRRKKFEAGNEVLNDEESNEEELVMSC